MFLPLTTAALAAAIFVADTITDLEIAAPVFYTTIVLLSVSFLKKNGIVFVGIGCIALTLLSDLLTVNSGVSEAGGVKTTPRFLGGASHPLLSAQKQNAKITPPSSPTPP